MGRPYCADIMMNSSAQHSSSKTFWSMALSWLNDGIDRTHFTVSISNFAADSNIMSWSFCVASVEELGRLCSVRISSELLTSSSLPFASLTDFAGIENVPGIWKGLVWTEPESFFVGNDLNALCAWNVCVKIFSRDSRDGSIEGVSAGINDGSGSDGGAGGGGGGANRLPFDAAKCNESKTLGWKALKCE